MPEILHKTLNFSSGINLLLKQAPYKTMKIISFWVLEQKKILQVRLDGREEESTTYGR